MAEIEHTPGPWVAHGGGHSLTWKGDIFASDAKYINDATHIARCFAEKPDGKFLSELDELAWATRQQTIVEANARLISAAPNMLEALLESQSELNRMSDDLGPCDHEVGLCNCDLHSIIARNDAAISKATQPDTPEASND